MNKRNLCAKATSALGVLRMVELAARRDCLLVLNYHRVGSPGFTEFDEAVYSATGEEFEHQVSYLRRRFTVLTLEEVVEIARSSKPFRGPGILITFDDGYIDNYQVAFPILRSLQVQGTFFLVSNYLNDPIVPWWDQIAYAIRNSQQKRLRLTYPQTIELPLSNGNRAETIRRVLSFYKSPRTEDTSRFLEEVKAACQPYRELSASTRLFLNADEAREMVRGGMAIGSHTRSHQILSKLSRERQFEEVAQSRTDLMRELGVSIEAFSYPVGGNNTFNEDSRSALQEAGYRLAFSFYGGLNPGKITDAFDIKRFGVDHGNPLDRFRLQIAGGIFTNGHWF